MSRSDRPVWKKELADLLSRNGIRRASKSRHSDVVSFASSDKRSQVLYQCFNQLSEMNFDVSSVCRFRGRHVSALVSRWREEELSVGTIHTRLSILRTFSGWIGKPGMVGATEDYLPAGESRRSIVATYDRSWRAAGVDADKLIASVSVYDEVVGMQLRLCHAFFMRREEAIMFRPHRCDEGEFIRLYEGTKGGRERRVRIETDYQRRVLEEAKRITPGFRSYLGGKPLTLKQALRRFNYVMERFGITRDGLGITAHGLRHEGLNDLFEEIAGISSPVRAADPVSELAKADPDRLDLARQRVSEAAGHARLSISGAYIGGLVGAEKIDPSPKGLAAALSQLLELSSRPYLTPGEVGRVHALRLALSSNLPAEVLGDLQGKRAGAGVAQSAKHESLDEPIEPEQEWI